jgi:hypothetical protein
VCWPDFGLTVTPSADNCCALLSNVLTGQRLTCWPQVLPYISMDLMVSFPLPSHEELTTKLTTTGPDASRSQRMCS